MKTPPIRGLQEKTGRQADIVSEVGEIIKHRNKRQVKQPSLLIND